MGLGKLGMLKSTEKLTNSLFRVLSWKVFYYKQSCHRFVQQVTLGRDTENVQKICLTSHLRLNHQAYSVTRLSVNNPSKQKKMYVPLTWICSLQSEHWS